MIYLVISACAGAYILFRILRRHEERKAAEREQAKKQRFDAYMKAQSESRINITRQNRRVS